MENSKEIIQVDIFGLSLTSGLTGGGYALILKEIEGERRIPIIIGQYEAQAIAMEIEGVTPQRPLTHDLLKNLLDELGISVDCVIINEMKDSTFHAKIKFISDIIEEIDSRPSDAIAIALKFKAPLFISKDLMNELSFVPKENDVISQINFENEDPKYMDEEQKSEMARLDKDTLLKQLKDELDKAVNNEEYEKAAELRDEIKKIELSNIN